MGPRAGLEGAEILVPTGIRSRTVHPLVVIPTELPGPRIFCDTTGNGKGKGKGKFHPRRGHEGPEGSRGIAVLFL